MSKLFSSKKKANDGPTTNSNEQALNALSQPASPNLKKSSTMRWKKSKKQLPELKPQLDLSAALPSTDDFRTSLLMPSLSTRFSMLREQDDPTSLLGKASDDSVLLPRRKSRMMHDFGFASTALGDIAEVSSFKGSVRPPFARTSRENSYISEDGYGSEADATQSVMSRSRPGEGNVLFGGRQKVYKIPTSGATSTRSLGKLVYEDDVGMSAFQKFRHKDREIDESQLPRPSDESQGFDFGLDTLPNDSAKDLSHSPSLSSYEKKRSTTSSMARSDARSSTAATSIASQQAVSAQPSPGHAPAGASTASTAGATANPAPITMSAPLLERPNPKGRRLYDQGLDQHMHEQHSSAITRLNSLQKQRTIGGMKSPPFLQGAKSTGNLTDRSTEQIQTPRGQSPPPSAPLPALRTFGFRNAQSGSSSPAPPSGPGSPIEAPNDVLTQALEPADRGKATAMGAFNKPAHAFDENQYLERQKALQRSNSTAVMRKTGNVSAAKSCTDRPDQGGHQSPDPFARSRTPSDAPSPHDLTKKAYNMFQNAANHLPAAHAQQRSGSPAKSPLPDTHRTFFGNISASDDEDDEEEERKAQSFNQPEYGYGNYQTRWQPTPLQSVSEHPSMKNEKSKISFAEEEDEYAVKPLVPRASASSLRINAPPASIQIPRPSDSPTLGPQAQALNGMVHHLRQRSNNSSIYPQEEVTQQEDEVPEVPEVPWTAKKSDSYRRVASATLDAQAERQSTYAVSNPWDLDEQSALGASRASRASEAVSPVDRSSMAQFSPVERTSSPRFPSTSRQTSVVQDVTPKSAGADTRNSEASFSHDNSVPAWQQELHRQHTRDASTATQQERDAFQSELAARRAAIQEGLKQKVEREANSRGTSPAPSAMRAFGMLRSKTSRESFVHAQDQSQKGFRAMGINGANSTSLLDSVRPRGNSSPRPPVPNAQHPAFKQEGPGPSTRDMDAAQGERALTSNLGPANTSRSRSNSTATTGRSRSRTGPYRDDLEKAMFEGHGTSATAHTPDVSPFPGASPAIGNDGVGRRSDEDRQNAANYFDAKTVTGAKGYTPGRPVPVANPYSQNQTPTLSEVSPSIDSHSPITPSSARPDGLRKMTISKADISEPRLISSTSNVDTVDLPPGASLKNGMDDAPPIPPINPKRRGTRKLFSRNRLDTAGEHEIKATASDPALNTSPMREYQFPPSNVVRMPAMVSPQEFQSSHGTPQYGFADPDSPERVQRSTSTTTGLQRSVTAPLTAPLDGSMF
ncbi:hypothetical protein DOTSEDRAFT_55414 [Dothistroma septosporum NZE10]|uniref:Uncharacterized protein n=1 Tax=Dothistroma septosporum (strain NZE10 / CBS 128990) TaxID=675120 RepID=N1PK27_DOTSN|nr:hypothetical protein DOTSEDRAFT_55414 [Dothistroma septosporum NZE10]